MLSSKLLSLITVCGIVACVQGMPPNDPNDPYMECRPKVLLYAFTPTKPEGEVDLYDLFGTPILAGLSEKFKGRAGITAFAFKYDSPTNPEGNYLQSFIDLSKRITTVAFGCPESKIILGGLG
jgi:hypothetical protein